jgi:signal recognition particle receptor subunit beta
MIAVIYLEVVAVFWIPIGIAIAVAVAAAGAATAFKVFGSEAKNAKVAVLGPRKAGKTTLGHYLESGTITAEYVASRGTEKHRGEIMMKDLKLKVVFATPGGDKEQYAAWLESATSAKVVVFMFDLSRLNEKAYAKEALKGAKNIQNWVQTEALQANTKIIVVGTHRDQQPQGGDANHFQQTSNHPTVREINRRLKPVESCYVSLMRPEGQNDVLFTVGLAAGDRI